MSKYPHSLLSQLRQVTDAPADVFIGSVFKNAGQKSRLQASITGLTQNSHLKEFADSYPDHSFLADAAMLPIWADKKKMKLGADFFARNAQMIMNLLGLLSLPYCYAAADGAKVLSLSQRMNSDVGKRLYETAEFVWEVMAPEAYEPSGGAFASIVKVRLMHAGARFYVTKSNNWNNAWGLPVNQEDMAGTNLSFSLIVIRGLRKFGITVDYLEQQAFMHLWNVIGYKLGLMEDLLPQTAKEAFELEEAIRVRHFKPSPHGQQLTASLLKYFTSVNTGEQFTNKEILQVMCYLLGYDVANILGLPQLQISPGKMRLMQTVNYLSGLKLIENESIVYMNGFHQFKQNKPALD